MKSSSPKCRKRVTLRYIDWIRRTEEEFFVITPDQDAALVNLYNYAAMHHGEIMLVRIETLQEEVESGVQKEVPQISAPTEV